MPHLVYIFTADLQGSRIIIPGKSGSYFNDSQIEVNCKGTVGVLIRVVFFSGIKPELPQHSVWEYIFFYVKCIYEHTAYMFGSNMGLSIFDPNKTHFFDCKCLDINITENYTWLIWMNCVVENGQNMFPSSAMCGEWVRCPHQLLLSHPEREEVSTCVI